MLKRVSIQNFKSLKDVTLDLQKVNLLIGPNNSGKTNFLKALELIGPNRKENHDLSQITFNKDLHNKIEIKLLWPSDRVEYVYKGVEFFLDGKELSDQKGYFENKHLEIEPGYASISQDFFPDFNIKLPISTLELQMTRIYKPDPNKLTKPGPVGTGAELISADVSNLIGFLDRMLGNKYRKPVFNRIEDDLHKCVPEFDQIELDDITSTKELIRLHGEESSKNSFKRLGLINSKQGVTYWADELSEGTLYFIALLCIINQPNPPKLLLLEEPEKGIHPRRIREIMNFIRRLVAEKDIQVIMTTHSPLLLDEFAESPEGVFVFDKDNEGATYVKNLQYDIIEPANQKNAKLELPPVHYTDALGEYWTIGFLGGVPHETN